jgi:hypothetical protein
MRLHGTPTERPFANVAESNKHAAPPEQEQDEPSMSLRPEVYVSL